MKNETTVSTSMSPIESDCAHYRAPALTVTKPMKRFLAYLENKEVHPTIQFGKYGLVGCIAVVTDVLAFYLLALFVFPALTQDDFVASQLARWHTWMVAQLPYLADQQWLADLALWQIVEIGESRRSTNYAINRTIVFFLSNVVAYILNVAWVFTPGRHSKHRETIWFFFGAMMSFFVGTTLGSLLIAFWGLDTSVALAFNIAAAVLVNFLFRKHWVFLR